MAGRSTAKAVLGFIAWSHIGFALGIARRALDELIRQVTRTQGAYRPSPLHERQVGPSPGGQVRPVDLTAARLLAHDRYRRGCGSVLKPASPIDAAAHAELQAIALHVTDLATRDRDRPPSATAGPARSMNPTSSERLLRDIQAASQHIFVSDVNYEVHGTHVLGLTRSAEVFRCISVSSATHGPTSALGLPGLFRSVRRTLPRFV